MHTLPGFFLRNTCLLSVFIQCGSHGAEKQRQWTAGEKDQQAAIRTDRLTWALAVRSAQCVHWWWTPLSCRPSASCRSNLCWRLSLCDRKGESYRSALKHLRQIYQKLGWMKSWAESFYIFNQLWEKWHLLLQSDWQDKNQFTLSPFVEANKHLSSHYSHQNSPNFPVRSSRCFHSDSDRSSGVLGLFPSFYIIVGGMHVFCQHIWCLMI